MKAGRASPTLRLTGLGPRESPGRCAGGGDVPATDRRPANAGRLASSRPEQPERGLGRQFSGSFERHSRNSTYRTNPRTTPRHCRACRRAESIRAELTHRRGVGRNHPWRQYSPNPGAWSSPSRRRRCRLRQTFRVVTEPNRLAWPARQLYSHSASSASVRLAFFLAQPAAEGHGIIPGSRSRQDVVGLPEPGVARCTSGLAQTCPSPHSTQKPPLRRVPLRSVVRSLTNLRNWPRHLGRAR